MDQTVQIPYTVRRAIWLKTNGYTGPIKGICGRGSDFYWLDHGFTAKHIATGRRVLFGDPYNPATTDVPAIAEQYGLECRFHSGLHNDGTTLIEVLVVDPSKAWRIFSTGCERSVGQIEVGQPAQFLGTTLAAARALESAKAVSS